MALALSRSRTLPVIAGLLAVLLILSVTLGPMLLRRVSTSLSQLGLGAFAYGYAYDVEFAHAAGLRAGAQVRIAGLRKGIVRTIRLGDQKVIAEVVLQDDIKLGDETTASIKMASVLGNQYVALELKGDDTLEHGATIPIERTQVPYTLSELAYDTTHGVGKLDTDQMRQLMEVMTDTLEQTPEVNRLAIQQVQRLTEATAARDEQIRTLVEQTAEATAMVNSERNAIFALMGEADVVIQAVHQRRALLHQLIVDTEDMARQVNQLIAENKDRIDPTLRQLETVLATLSQNKKVLTTLIDRMAVSVRYFNNVTGTGPYASVYLPYGPAPDQSLCFFGLARECR